MNKARVVSLLLHLYPARWRAEYGAELSAILQNSPLTVSAINDVAWSAIGERVRATSLATRIGIAAMSLTTTWLAANLVAPPARPDSWAWLLRDSDKTLPTLIVFPLQSGIAIIAGAAYGFWMRERETRRQVARDAAWIWLLAGVPVICTAALMMVGAVANPDPQRYRTMAMLVSPLFAVPGAAMYAALGMGRPGPRETATQLHLHD